MIKFFYSLGNSRISSLEPNSALGKGREGGGGASNTNRKKKIAIVIMVFSDLTVPL